MMLLLNNINHDKLSNFDEKNQAYQDSLQEQQSQIDQSHIEQQEILDLLNQLINKFEQCESLKLVNHDQRRQEISALEANRKENEKTTEENKEFEEDIYYDNNKEKNNKYKNHDHPHHHQQLSAFEEEEKRMEENKQNNNYNEECGGIRIQCPFCIRINIDIAILKFAVIILLICYLVTYFGVYSGVGTIYNDLKNVITSIFGIGITLTTQISSGASSTMLATINATKEAVSLIESKLDGYHLESHNIAQWKQVWNDNINLFELHEFSDLVHISCHHDEFDDKLSKWFVEQFNVIQSIESSSLSTDGIYERTLYDKGKGYVRIGIISIKKSDNAYKMLLACRQNTFTLSFDHFGWFRGPPPNGLEYFVFEKAKIELAQKIKTESNAGDLIKICQSNQDCKQ